MEPIFHCTCLDDFTRFYRSSECQAHRRFELNLAAAHRDEENYVLPGMCEVDGASCSFAVDRVGAAFSNGVSMPNWRERLICSLCGLNNRQRLMAFAVLEKVRSAAARGEKPVVYLMEQVTPMYKLLSEKLADAELIGSEYLNESLKSGELSNGIRHEDVEQLSFDDQTVDLIVSNDVFEHVAEPCQGFLESFRVLKPGGELFFTVPLDCSRWENEVLAEREGDTVKHFVKPVYHGDPLRQEGALMYTLFGWQILDQLKSSGFSRCEARFFWSRVHGYLAHPFLIHAVKEG